MNVCPELLSAMAVGMPLLLGCIGWAGVRALRRRSIGSCFMPVLGLSFFLVLIVLLVIYPPLN